jgi:hypothetical protein
MKRKIILNLVATVTILAPVAPFARAGVLVGNGGDSVQCIAVPENRKFPITGLYVLDYVVNFPYDLRGIVQIQSLSQSLDRIENLIRLKAPFALESFLNYRASLLPTPFTNTVDRIWFGEMHPLVNVQDEFARFLPPNCRMRGQGQTYKGIYQQTVIRVHGPRAIRYRYDNRIMQDYLSRADAMQASVLLVHEWLWDFYDQMELGSPRIRNANYFLHSASADSATAEGFVRSVFYAPVKM